MSDNEFKQPALEDADKPAPTNADGLRTDGPTLAEYLEAGYTADTYPPKGYASREPVTEKEPGDWRAQPKPAARNELPQPVATKAIVNTGKTDELSQAVVAMHAPKPVAPVPPEPQGPGKYRLDYVLNGEAITETHRTVRQALAGVRRLKMLGIIPATSTAA